MSQQVFQPEDIDLYFAPLDLTKWDKEARQIMRERMWEETGNKPKKKVTKSTQKKDDDLAWQKREPMSDYLKRVWWLINNHGTPQWAKEKGIKWEQHLINVEVQYTRRGKKTEHGKAFEAPRDMVITEQTEEILPITIKIPQA